MCQLLAFILHIKKIYIKLFRRFKEHAKSNKITVLCYIYHYVFVSFLRVLILSQFFEHCCMF